MIVIREDETDLLSEVFALRIDDRLCNAWLEANKGRRAAYLAENCFTKDTAAYQLLASMCTP